MVDELKGEGLEEKPKAKPNPTTELFKTIQEQKKQIQELMDTTKMLLEVADTKQLAHFYSKNQKKLPREVMLNMIGNDVVTSWVMKTNEVYQDSRTKQWVENQIVLLTLDNDSILEMSYTDFVRKTTKSIARILSSKQDEETGDLMVDVLKLDDNKKLSINIKFVN